MGAGAVYDLGFAVAILAFTRPAAAMLGLTVPEDAVYLYLNGVFLLLVAGMYALPARDAQRYEGVVAVAAAGRAAGFVVLALCWAAGRPAAFLALALVDLAFAGAHAALLARARRS
jgi:hypothetical protein